MLLQSEVVQCLNAEFDFIVFAVVFDTPKLHLSALFWVFMESDLLYESTALEDHVIEADILSKVILEMSLKLS